MMNPSFSPVQLRPFWSLYFPSEQPETRNPHYKTVSAYIYQFNVGQIYESFFTGLKMKPVKMKAVGIKVIKSFLKQIQTKRGKMRI